MDPQTTAFINILSNPSYTLLFLVLVVWSLAWKGVALWKAARQNQRNWFVALLVLNTFGILEIMYTFWFGNVKQQKNIDENQIH